MNVSEFIIKSLINHNINQSFMVTGGAAMHLNDAIGRHRGLKYVCCHHEQACAIAAEGYFRASGKMAVVLVTAGPGGINALNGVFGARTDSIPMLVITGQSKRETLISSTKLPLRQLGDQEVDIVRMLGGITKYAVQILNPDSVRYHLGKAIYLATHGRPGPVWLFGSGRFSSGGKPAIPTMSAPTKRSPFLSLLKQWQRPWGGCGVRYFFNSSLQHFPLPLCVFC